MRHYNEFLAAFAGVAGSLIGIFGAGTLFFLDPQVPEEYVSHPLTPDAFRLTEVLWTLSHVLFLVAAYAFVRSGAAGMSRLARVGGVAALAGFGIQVVAEFALVFFAESMETDTGPVVISTLFGISSMLIGLGLVGLGIGTLRAGVWTGWQRVAPLVWGIWSLAYIPLLFGGVFFLGLVSWFGVGLLLWAAMLTAHSRQRDPTANATGRPDETGRVRDVGA